MTQQPPRSDSMVPTRFRFVPLLVAVAAYAARAIIAAPPPPPCPAWGPHDTDAQAVTSPDRHKKAAAGGVPADRHDAVFGELTPDEHDAVNAFLLAQPGLGLVDVGGPDWRARQDRAFGALVGAWGRQEAAPNGADAGLAAALREASRLTSDNYVYSMWREAPPKYAALAYLNGSAPRPPPRKARAVLVLPTSDPPRIEEVLVTLDAGDADAGGPRTGVTTATPAAGAPVRAHTLERVPLEGTRGATASLPLAYAHVSSAELLVAYSEVAKVAPQLNAFLEVAFHGRRLCGTSRPGNATIDAATPCRSCIMLANPYQFSARQSRRNASETVRVLGVMFGVAQESAVPGAACETVDRALAMLVPLEFRVEATSPAQTEWTTTGWWFEGAYHDSLDALQASVAAHPRSPPVALSARSDGGRQFVGPRDGPKRGADQWLGPVPHEPYGRRFTVSAGTSPRVQGLGWGVTVGYKVTSGPRFWDLTFKGERIVYELSMQEMACDTGFHNPDIADAFFLESAWGLGTFYRELVHGRDCPLGAVFVDAHSWSAITGGRLRTHPNAICVFEHDPGHGAARHYNSLYGFYESVRGGDLVIRSAYDGVYEHVFDLILSVDGTVRFAVRKAGTSPNMAPLAFGGRANPVDSAYVGPRYALDALGGGDRGGATIVPAPFVLAASFKIDLDIGAADGAGMDNSLHTYRLQYERVAQGGFAYGRPVPAYSVATETGAAAAVDARRLAGTVPVVVAEGETARGAAPGNPPRGYAIHVHNAGNMAPPLADWGDGPFSAGTWSSASLDFVRWPFAATRQSDDQPIASVPYRNAGWLADPDGSRWGLASYVRAARGSLRHSDVVAWVSSSAFYLPSLEWEPALPTGSMPVLGFELKPFNWAAENPATDMADAVVVKVASVADRGKAGASDGAAGPGVDRVERAVREGAQACRPRADAVPFLRDGFEP